MGVYKLIENGETPYGTIPCESIQPLEGDKIKYNASIEELKQIVDWMERVTTIPKGSTIK